MTDTTIIDPFADLDALRRNGEETEREVEAQRPTKRQERKSGYALIPAGWLAALYRARHRSSWVVAVRLLELARKTKSRKVLLGSELLRKRVVNARAKQRALRELVTLGLISLEQGVGQAPRVRLLVDPNS